MLVPVLIYHAHLACIRDEALLMLYNEAAQLSKGEVPALRGGHQ